MSPLLNRQFWTPLLVLAGSLLLVSGLFLLFHLESHIIVGIHQMVSVVFITACVAHIALNRKPLLKALGSPITVLSLLAVVLFSFLIMVFSDIESGYKHRHGERYKKSHKILRLF